MKMQQPVTIDELYEKARYLLLCCYTSYNFVSYGKLHNPRRYYVVKDWGSLVIMDTTAATHCVYTPYNRMEIPKYAAVKYI